MHVKNVYKLRGRLDGDRESESKMRIKDMGMG